MPAQPIGAIADKTYAALSADNGPLEHVGDEPLKYRGTSDLTQFELDLRDWGMVYGIAYAITRMDDPFESPRDCAQRAVPAARMAWGRWSDGFKQRAETGPDPEAGPPSDEERAYDEAHPAVVPSR